MAAASHRSVPDIGGRAARFVVVPGAEAGELSFLLTNCSTGGEKLVIEKIGVYGDNRCYFADVTSSDIRSQSQRDTASATEILPGETSVVRTTYNPKQPGEDFAEIRVTSNAENFPTLRLRVCGRAEAPAPDAGPPPAVDAGVADGGGTVVRDAGAPDAFNFECKAVEKLESCHSETTF